MNKVAHSRKTGEHTAGPVTWKRATQSMCTNEYVNTTNTDSIYEIIFAKSMIERRLKNNTHPNFRFLIG